MDYKQVEKRMNDEIDRLSNLPDDLIHKILSFVGIKCAIETSALSSRWRFIWTSMPYLDFLVEDFSTPPKLSQFVTQVLSRRNNLVEVFSIKLRFRGYFSQEFVKQLLNYAFSHNIRQLDITWLYEKGIDYPLSLICSRSLTHLSLRKKYVYRIGKGYGFTSTSTLKLPLLTSLYLEDIIFCCDDDSDKCVGIFSECVNLKILTLKGCKVTGFSHLNICLPLLSNLTLADVHGKLNSVNLSLSFAPFYYSLEKVELCVTHSIVSAHKMVCLFQQLQRVKYLTLNMEILEFLSSSVELISNQPSPFANLKSLHIYPIKDLSEVRNDVKMSSEVKNYLLENSPSATFTMVSREVFTS
ncbi:F-box domain containing protein [Tanacetum coccineum]|uniref:F-box domain containing protein n=1 Tax=Tanacetum coccineum TaxID=301880 RepID=A0ABQ5IWI9_9ASTR